MVKQYYRVILLGQPNVGKSSLLRALTGANVNVSNYPGTTVELYRARRVIGDKIYEFIDTPGIYNLYPSSLEEEVTERTLLEEDYDFAIVVLDATAIERGLVFLTTVAELGIPLIVAINFWEEAERKGIKIDYKSLEKALGVPVVRINPLRRNGVRELFERLGEARRPRVIIRYDDHIEAAIEKAIKCIPLGSRLSRRGLAVRLVEGDRVVWEKFGCSEAEKAREELLKAGHNPHEDIEAGRAGYALSLARRTVRVVATGLQESWFDRLVLTKPIFGIIFTVLVLTALLVFIVYAGGLVVNSIDKTLGGIVENIASHLEKEGLYGFIASRVLRALYAQYAAALPYVFLFYIIIVSLEDTGFLSRLLVWIHGASRRLGLHGKIVIPALLGLGCSVPAIMATRVLPSSRQRIAAISMFAFIPCSSRAAIVFAVAGRYLGVPAVLAIYTTGFILAVAVSTLVARLVRGLGDAILVEDIPPLRIPQASNIAVKAWTRLREFIILVTPLVAGGAAVYALIEYYGLSSIILGPLTPIALALKLPPQALVPLIYGFLQKDLVISMLAASLGATRFDAILTPHQLMTFTLASTYQVPCIIAFLVMVREIGFAKAIAMLLALDSIGFLVATVYANTPIPPLP